MRYDIKFQTRLPEHSDMLAEHTTICNFDIDNKSLTLGFDISNYEIRTILGNHFSKHEQHLNIYDDDVDYRLFVGPMIRRHINDNLQEIEYIIHAISKEKTI